MKVEYFFAEGCERCVAARKDLQATVQSAAPEAVWGEIEAVKELDYAVELGVASLPAVAVDGKLLLLPSITPESLGKALRARRQELSNGR